MQYEELLRMMQGNQETAPDYSGGEQLQQGLLGAGPGTPTAEQTLDSMRSKNQANMQNMLATGQQGIQAGMQSAQNLQNQRQAEMNAAQQQAGQALQQQAQQQARNQQAVGQLVGTVAKSYMGGEGKSDSGSDEDKGMKAGDIFGMLLKTYLTGGMG
jgi:hypothetical protein